MSTITQWEGVFTHVDENGNKQQMFPEIKTDSTLTLGGKAADAAATGAMIKKATPVKIKKADFDNLTEEQKSTGSYLITDAGLEFAGGSGGGIAAVDITQAEYDALSQEEKMNGSLYAINDAPDLEAKNIAYDGSETGLGSNVQEAIDNVDSKVDNVQDSVKNVNNSLKNENNETFNFGIKDGVRGFFTDPSRADDSFIPFKQNESGVLEMQTGTGTVVSFTKYTAKTVAITFEKEFSKVPTVYCTGTALSWCGYWATDVTTTGFSFVYMGSHESTNGASTTLSWVAYTTED